MEKKLITEMKFMMERLENPRMTYTEYEKKYKILSETKYDGPNKNQVEKAFTDFLSKIYWLKSNVYNADNIVINVIDNVSTLIQSWMSDLLDVGNIDVTGNETQEPLNKKGEDSILVDVKKYIEQMEKYVSTGKYQNRDVYDALTSLKNIL